MYRLTSGSVGGHPDVERLVNTLNAAGQDRFPPARELFTSDQPVFVARAPGRLDVMGGIADYSGSLVLEMPIREAATVAVQRHRDRVLRIVSMAADSRREPLFQMPLADFESAGEPVEYAVARARFSESPTASWAAYIAGAFLVLMRECGVRFADGADLLLASDVPEGKGVSSSAAIEVAAMQAIAAAYRIELDPVQLAVLCQKVENLVVGAPCGLMDQMTSACGQADRLLALLCQPAELRGTLPIPDEIEFWGIDSGLRHCVAGADYGAVRIGAFMGYRIIAELAGLRIQAGEKAAHVRVEDPLWQGYLANVTPSVFDFSYRERLPEQMSGRDFLARYGGTTDTVTTIHPDRKYAVRQPTAHPVFEHFRVQSFGALLAAGSLNDERLGLLGELMYQSHASYSACGLGSEGTDLIVDLVRQAGPAQGLFGAKITGGGSGGTVAVLARRGSRTCIEAVARKYADRTGREPYLFSGSSAGAAAFGTITLRPELS